MKASPLQMSMERCLQQPTNRTESFARCLHDRLCSLSGTNQDPLLNSAGHRLSLSSSSDDVFYDLDSSPGSPTEVATDGLPLHRLVINHEPDNLSSPFPDLWPNDITPTIEEPQPCKTVDHLDVNHKGLNHTQCDIESNITSDSMCEVKHSKPTIISSDSSFAECGSTCNLNHSGPYAKVVLGPEVSRGNTECPAHGSFATSNGYSSLESERNCCDEKKLCLPVFSEDAKGSLVKNVDSCISEFSDQFCKEKRIEDQSGIVYCDYERSSASLLDVQHNSSLNRIGLQDSNLQDKNNDKIFSEEMGCSSDSVSNATVDAKQDSDSATVAECISDVVVNIVKPDDISCSTNMVAEEVAIECTATDSRALVKLLRGSFEKEKSVVGVEECEEEEDIEMRRARFRRCSSLKTGKTPPGTPGQKKIVRFADCYGLDLTAVRTFLDDIPKIPQSAFEDLTNAECCRTSDRVPSVAETLLVRPDRTVVALFTQPGGLPDFLDRVQRNQVSLENAVVTDKFLFAITGTVRVRNLDFNKSVHIRYSINNWASHSDLQARYVANSCDGFSDMFTFQLYAHTLNLGQRIEFAVRFQAKGVQYWDSNDGANYAFQCVPLHATQQHDLPPHVTQQNNPPSQVPEEVPIETWGSFY